MKIIKYFLIVLASILTISIFNVSACENKDELVEDNFDYLTGIFPEYVIDAMTCDEISYVIDNHFELRETEEVLDIPEYLPNVTATHGTASKGITLSYFAGGTAGLVTFCADWYAIPAVRSHDIIALRFSGVSYGSAGTSSYFKYDTSTASYRTDSNMSSNNVTSASNGVGFTYKLPTTNDLQGLYFFLSTYVTGTGTVYGSYQHAKSTVTKASAMNYVFSSGGLGGVISHASSTTRAKYDGMAGVHVSV